MVGIFQMFGISFLFWVFVGVLRFVFETLHSLRETAHRYTILTMILSGLAGVSISISLFFVFFFTMGPVDPMVNEASFPTVALSMLIVWLGCVTLGSYLATRIYIARPYLVASIVGFGTVVVGITLLIIANIEFALSRSALQWQLIWIVVTILAAILGGHMAHALNALERERSSRRKAIAAESGVKPEEVAVVIAAHNEELSIGKTLQALMEVTKPENVYIGSDGSSDKTVEIARSFNVNVEDIHPNKGKALALTHVLEKNDILNRYKAVFFLDAEIRPSKQVFTHALPLFDDPDIVVIVNRAMSVWPKHYLPRWNLVFTAYRIRLWRVLQFCIRYGQTWKYTNASPIIPGGSSIYRTSALKHIQIHVPGLIIEDFNMTFNVHHQRLGKIGYSPSSYVWDQEPYSLRDYIKQVRRWYLGFFQTVRHHGVWPSWFFFSMAFFTLELIVGSVLFILAPFFMLELLLSGRTEINMMLGFSASSITIFGLVISLFVIDFIVTIIVAMIEKKPLLLVYWITFFPLRYVEAVVFLYTLVIGLFIKPKTDGRWISPKRMAQPL